MLYSLIHVISKERFNRTFIRVCVGESLCAGFRGLFILVAMSRSTQMRYRLLLWRSGLVSHSLEEDFDHAIQEILKPDASKSAWNWMHRAVTDRRNHIAWTWKLFCKVWNSDNEYTDAMRSAMIRRAWPSDLDMPTGSIKLQQVLKHAKNTILEMHELQSPLLAALCAMYKTRVHVSSAVLHTVSSVSSQSTFLYNLGCMLRDSKAMLHVHVRDFEFFRKDWDAFRIVGMSTRTFPRDRFKHAPLYWSTLEELHLDVPYILFDFSLFPSLKSLTLSQDIRLDLLHCLMKLPNALEELHICLSDLILVRPNREVVSHSEWTRTEIEELSEEWNRFIAKQSVRTLTLHVNSKTGTRFGWMLKPFTMVRRCTLVSNASLDDDEESLAWMTAFLRSNRVESLDLSGMLTTDVPSIISQCLDATNPSILESLKLPILRHLFYDEDIVDDYWRHTIGFLASCPKLTYLSSDFSRLDEDVLDEQRAKLADAFGTLEDLECWRFEMTNGLHRLSPWLTRVGRLRLVSDIVKVRMDADFSWIANLHLVETLELTILYATRDDTSPIVDACLALPHLKKFTMYLNGRLFVSPESYDAMLTKISAQDGQLFISHVGYKLSDGRMKRLRD